MKNMSMAILAGDWRQVYMARYLAAHGCQVALFAPASPIQDFPLLASVTEACQNYTTLIGPVPFFLSEARTEELKEGLHSEHLLAGGNLPEEISAYCQQQKIACYDFMQSPTLALYNAEITAEGMIAQLLQQTPFILQKKQILLLGYGKCGAALATKLRGMDAIVLVYDHDPVRQALAAAYGFTVLTRKQLSSIADQVDVVVNSVPAPILNGKDYQRFAKHCVLFDLASGTQGLDLELAQQQQLSAYRCPGLPGKIAPKTAGEALGRDLLDYLLNRKG